MNSGKEKWWIGALAIVIAIMGGLFLHFSSGPTGKPAPDTDKIAASTTESTPATTHTTDTQNQAASPQQSADITPTTEAAAPSVANADTAQPATQQATPPATVTASAQPAAEEAAPQPAASPPVITSYQSARWDPIHFKPAIDKASNADCLSCHQDILERNVRDASPAGLKTANTLAWYQTLDVYEGEQMTFHQRHLTAPFINKVANMSCTTCHQGNDPREEISGSALDTQPGLTMRKMVDPNTCLMCHGEFNYKVMGLPGPWHESGKLFQNNCMTCHAAIRTNRHQVNFLKADAIEAAGAANSDSCYGCHGGRSWYRISYPYPRHAWPGMGDAVPDWATDRPTESDMRFLIQGEQASEQNVAATGATQ